MARDILLQGSDERRPLIPDVAYFAPERLTTIQGGSERDRAFPPLASNIAFEVVSDTDECADIEAKGRRLPGPRVAPRYRSLSEPSRACRVVDAGTLERARSY